ncbi:MAG: hypothetical protein R3D29_15005 [Nitratireductor sp.]
MTRHLLILGAGFSGIAAGIACRNDFELISGTSRNATRFHELRATGMAPLVFDGSLNRELRAAISTASHVLVSIAPGNNDPVLTALGEALAAAGNLQWLCYLSTVSVYGDHQGVWSGQESECRPVSARSRERIGAETMCGEILPRRNPCRSQSIGFPAFTGRVATPSSISRRGTSRRLVKPGQVFNRIHHHDIGEAVRLGAIGRANGFSASRMTDRLLRRM